MPARLLVVNNMPARYRSAPFAALAREWHSATGGDAEVLYQVRRDPLRREEWFFSDHAEMTYRHSFLSPRSMALTKRSMTLYPPRFGIGHIRRLRPTHLFVAGWDTPLSLACAVYARATGATLSLWIESNGSTSKRSGRLANSYKRFILGAASGVLTPTSASLRLVDSLATQQLRFEVVPNPIDLPRIPDREAEPSGRRLIFIGEFSERKGFDLFLEACRLGDGEGWRGLAMGNPVAGVTSDEFPPNVEIVPAAPLETRLGLIHPNDVWCIPSRTDPAPLTYSEALSLGLRVAVSDSIAYAEHAGKTIGAATHQQGSGLDLLRTAETLVDGPRPPRSASDEVSSAGWSRAVLRTLAAGS